MIAAEKRERGGSRRFVASLSRCGVKGWLNLRFFFGSVGACDRLCSPRSNAPGMLNVQTRRPRASLTQWERSLFKLFDVCFTVFCQFGTCSFFRSDRRISSSVVWSILIFLQYPYISWSIHHMTVNILASIQWLLLLSYIIRRTRNSQNPFVIYEFKQKRILFIYK